MTFEATYLGSNGWFIKFKNSNLIIDPWLKGDLIFPPGEWFFKGSLEEEILIELNPIFSNIPKALLGQIMGISFLNISNVGI